MKCNHNSEILSCFQRVTFKDIKTINFRFHYNKIARKANEQQYAIAYISKA